MTEHHPLEPGSMHAGEIPAAAPEASDIPEKSWIDRLAPGWARPYLRLARVDRPIGTWLLLLPCWWSLALASQPALPDAGLLVLFALGALVMRGAGCTLNDIADRDFDGQVARTAQRPIPAGDVTVKQAFVFLGLQLLAGLCVLLQLNTFAIGLGCASLLLVALYPFAKRVTYWPQLVLGLTFNWGALLGWAAVRGDLALPAVLLYAAGVFWTLGYDTIYAHQDKEDDVLIGVKSTALKLGEKTRVWLSVFYALAIGLLTASGAVAGLGWVFGLSVAIAAAHMVWQVKTLADDNPQNCLQRFKANRDLAFVVLAGIILDPMLRAG